jgi:outer membrane protein assembly factor BamB
MNTRMKNTHRAVAAFAALSVLFVAAATSAADWPQWRGPNRDGVSPEKGLLQQWPKEGGIAAEPLYFEAKLPTAIGGAVKIGDCLYGTTAQALLCVEFKTGQVKWEARALGAASICYADGRLYLHGENGEVALAEASLEGYRERGRFTPPDPPKRANNLEKAWAYPVVAGGRLYLRDHGCLWCFDLR